jgi:penicillin-binding protein 1A
MALPIWGLYMKSCYEDKTLNVSTGDFDVPLNLSINVDCSTGSGNYVNGGDSKNTPDDLNF